MKDANSLEVRALGHPRPESSNSVLSNTGPCYQLCCLTSTWLTETRPGSAGRHIHKRPLWTEANWDVEKESQVLDPGWTP